MQEKRAKRIPSPRVQEKRRQARTEIIETALAVLARDGVDAVTLEAVARDLGMTKPALYHYFPSKEALMRSLVTRLISDEVETLVAAAEEEPNPLGAMIRAFHGHYVHDLNAFRAVYCQSQLYLATSVVMDPELVRDEINPRTQHLFDLLESQLAGTSKSRKVREHMRRLAFTAWTSVLGLLTMLSIAEAVDDPLLHTDKDLLDTLTRVFDDAASPQ